MRYLDPKNAPVFKKVFGRPRLLKSFLNALLPLVEPVESLEYLPAELVPEMPEMAAALKHAGLLSAEQIAAVADLSVAQVQAL